ncbi:3-hydroxyacyl-CoA dehydrogenase [Bordetella genomosp. 9]|uniref:3-hydroxyacyl-CoA dehydrogenase family protein n=1 Tax=Bordetella genomosp. 9 TaxID=1416803 RepID=UPI000A29556F|nr:3-hydroxyacyl-CoA dehydrogenase NAD-binding domain-containing protein [Bordetella genomosp. 9]ARP92123.1 3-hydroxyacyl-CoA dehydrogenase [Bordetella genomosp. 9]
MDTSIPALPRPSLCRAVVVGGGTMGADVAVVLARAQAGVTVVEPAADRHDTIRERTRAGLAERGMAELAQKIQVVASLDAVAWEGVHLVIECIPESLPMKRKLFADLVARAPAGALLASNSSSFPISEIAQGLDTRARMLGLHFFMPAHLIPLVEVVLGADSDVASGEHLAAFMRRCGMVPVLVRKDVPGFLGNRLQHALTREAFALIQEGVASAEDVDAAVRFGFGFRFLAAGPVMQRDHAGLDVHCAATATTYPSLSKADGPFPILTERVAAGKLGMKTGEGFYAWTPETMAAEKARYAALLRAGLALIEKELPPIEP